MLIKWIIIGYIVNAILMLSMLTMGINLTTAEAQDQGKELSEEYDGVLWLGIVLISLLVAVILTVIAAIIWPGTIIAFIRDVILKKAIR